MKAIFLRHETVRALEGTTSKHSTNRRNVRPGVSMLVSNSPERLPALLRNNTGTSDNDYADRYLSRHTDSLVLSSFARRKSPSLHTRARSRRSPRENRGCFSSGTGSEICNKSSEKFPAVPVGESGTFQVPAEANRVSGSRERPMFSNPVLRGYQSFLPSAPR